MTLFTGCDALITNAFKTANLGQPNPALLKSQDAATLIQEAGVLDGPVSDTFVQAVISDQDTQDAVIQTLRATVNESNTQPEEAQAAQALILEIELADIGANTVIENLNAAVPQLASLADSNEAPDAQDIINTLLPADLANDPTKLAEFIDNLDKLNEDIDNLADLIAINNNEVAAGLDIGSITQVAALVKFVGIVEPASEYSTGEAIAYAIKDLTDADDTNDDVTNYFASDSEPDIASLKDDPTLQTLFGAAGLPDFLNQIGS